MGVAIGIDLGTSNSCVCAVVDGEPVVFADKEGRRTQPSIVAFGYGKSAVVGWRARRQLLYAPESTVISAKRLIGRRAGAEEVERMKAQCAYGITEGEGGELAVRVQGKLFTPAEISAHVLVHMKKIAEEALGESVTQAVITVPAYFNDNQRQATRSAAAMAGLECLRILNEPTAAALAYGFNKGKRQHVAVYDLGGGTFDISILRIDDDFFEVIATSGDTFLGGDDFDYAAADQFMELFCAQTGLDLRANRTVRMKLREAAERAKVALSGGGDVEVSVPALHRAAGGQELGFHTTVDRFTYDQWVLPLVSRTFDVCDDALKAAGMSIRQIDHVLMVGGMTRYPLVREAVRDHFRKPPNTTVNPDEVVAIGAAIQAWNLTNTEVEGGGSVLLDVTPQSLGVRTLGGFCETLIPRNTAIPTESTKVFHTAVDNQTEVRISVCQGEGRMADDNELLGEFVLGGLAEKPRGQVRVRVTFEIDTDGIVHVRAIDSVLGLERSIRIESSGGASAAPEQSHRFDDIDF